MSAGPGDVSFFAIVSGNIIDGYHVVINRRDYNLDYRPVATADLHGDPEEAREMARRMLADERHKYRRRTDTQMHETIR